MVCSKKQHGEARFRTPKPHYSETCPGHYAHHHHTAEIMLFSATDMSIQRLDIGLKSNLNNRKTCPCHEYHLTGYNPLLYSKTGVCRGLPIFLIFAPKHRL